MKKIRSRYSSPDFQFVRFSLAGHEFGLDVSSVKEIIRYTAPQPGQCPAFAEGLVKVRSMLVPVIDLKKRFLMPECELKSTKIIIASIDSIIAGLMVDAVSDITLGAKEFTLKPEGEGAPWDALVEARVEAESGPVLILSASGILTAEEKTALSEPAAPSGTGMQNAGLGLKKPGFMC